MTAPVSVCVPTFNGVRFLPQCLESVLAQTFTELEVLVVDDASTDDTVSIAETFARRDARVRVRRNARNLGLVAAWNHCASQAQGEWIKFVFQDDVLAPECVARMLAAGESGSPLVICRREFTVESGVPGVVEDYRRRPLMDTVFGGRDRITPEEFADAALEHAAVNFVGEPTAVLLRRDLLQRFGAFDPELAAICDLEFWVRAGVHVGADYVAGTLATFRIHGGSKTADNLARAQYRMRRLDRLLLFRQYALAPVYEPLRARAALRSPPVDLTLMLAREARKARRRAGRRGDGPGDDPAATLALWQDLVRRHPEVLAFSRPTALLGRRLRRALMQSASLLRRAETRTRETRGRA